MNILAEIAPQYSVIGIALRLPMHSVGLLPYPKYHKTISDEHFNGGKLTVLELDHQQHIVTSMMHSKDQLHKTLEFLRQLYEQLKEAK
jgi:hypothetical protein